MKWRKEGESHRDASLRWSLRGFAIFALSLVVAGVAGQRGRAVQVALAVIGIGIVWGATVLGVVYAFRDDDPLQQLAEFARRHRLVRVAMYVAPFQLIGGLVGWLTAGVDERLIAFWVAGLAGTLPGVLLYVISVARR